MNPNIAVGPIPSYDTIYDPSTAPQWRIDIDCSESDINYGPWINHQRALIQKWFFPTDYENRKIYQPEPGTPRQHAALITNITFSKITKFTIPFSEFTQVLKYFITRLLIFFFLSNSREGKKNIVGLKFVQVFRIKLFYESHNCFFFFN